MDDDETQTEVVAFDLGGFTAYQAALAAQLLSDQFSEIYRREFGISVPEWRVMVHLTQADEASVRDIENQVLMEKSKVSRTATRLVKRGFVRKAAHSQDRRLVALSLTPNGHRMMARLLPKARDFQRALERDLGSDFQQLSHGLRAVIDRFTG